MTRVGGTAPPAPGNEIVVVSGRSERDAGLYEPRSPLSVSELRSWAVGVPTRSGKSGLHSTGFADPEQFSELRCRNDLTLAMALQGQEIVLVSCHEPVGVACFA